MANMETEGVEQLRSLFRSKASEKNGQLSLSFGDFVDMLGPMVPQADEQELRRVFDGLDEDGNQRVTFEEFLKAKSALANTGDVKGDASVASEDLLEDDDNFILTAEEERLKRHIQEITGPKMEITESHFYDIVQKRVPEITQDVSSALFRKIDEDGSGIVTFNELLKGFRDVEDALNGEMKEEMEEEFGLNRMVSRTDDYDIGMDGLASYRSQRSEDRRDSVGEAPLSEHERLKRKYIESIRSAEEQIEEYQKKAELFEKKYMELKEKFETDERLLEEKDIILANRERESKRRSSAISVIKENFEKEYDDLHKRVENLQDEAERERAKFDDLQSKHDKEVKALQTENVDLKDIIEKRNRKIQRLLVTVKNLREEQGSHQRVIRKIRQRNQHLIRENSGLQEQLSKGSVGKMSTTHSLLDELKESQGDGVLASDHTFSAQYAHASELELGDDGGHIPQPPTTNPKEQDVSHSGKASRDLSDFSQKHAGPLSEQGKGTNSNESFKTLQKERNQNKDHKSTGSDSSSSLLAKEPPKSVRHVARSPRRQSGGTSPKVVQRAPSYQEIMVAASKKKTLPNPVFSNFGNRTMDSEEADVRLQIMVLKRKLEIARNKLADKIAGSSEASLMEDEIRRKIIRTRGRPGKDECMACEIS
mmetsp:Transcript_11384/g.28029  ORF Transcript_11384/g.28029 Transcript_11384/m.28029 type:complete len:651 (-) Transcript_11384:155-2107(-)|eukprot:CAMPEP_0114528068 /NCGR_PEP_ID=MMETSP0109-20121206/23986_1 /TAXON_ID=29199 /ORGANISM="Chlorarachnion reptans, Strain CCCM449" /LENGTH=650 /DNA_ID=CAMNT_0001710143 /DNA_START=155 /DNA_END=2107 /DNA_ORIENTATION=-